MFQSRTTGTPEDVAANGFVVAHGRHGCIVGNELLGIRVTGMAVIVIAAFGLLKDRFRFAVPF